MTAYSIAIQAASWWASESAPRATSPEGLTMARDALRLARAAAKNAFDAGQPGTVGGLVAECEHRIAHAKWAAAMDVARAAVGRRPVSILYEEEHARMLATPEWRQSYLDPSGSMTDRERMEADGREALVASEEFCRQAEAEETIDRLQERQPSERWLGEWGE